MDVKYPEEKAWVDFYNRKCCSYDKFYFNGNNCFDGPNFQKTCKALNLNFENKQLLDAGCGIGKLAVFLAIENPTLKVFGIDYSKMRLKQGAKMAAISNVKDRCKFRLKDINLFVEKTPLTFDIIFSFETFEHLLHPHKAMRKLKKLLNPGGIILGSVPLGRGGRQHLSGFRTEKHIERILKVKTLSLSGVTFRRRSTRLFFYQKP